MAVFRVKEAIQNEPACLLKSADLEDRRGAGQQAIVQQALVVHRTPLRS